MKQTLDYGMTDSLIRVKPCGTRVLHIKLLTNLLIWVAMAWAFTHLQLPGNTLFFVALQNAGHGLAFALITWLAIKTFINHQEHFNWPGALGICVLLSLLGIFIELVQHVTGRPASLPDILMNSVGMLSGLAASHIRLLPARSVSALDHKPSPPVVNQPVKHVLVWALAAAVPLAWCLHKPVWFLLADINAQPLPTLMDFEPLSSKALLKPSNALITLGDHSDTWEVNNSRSAKVDFSTGLWPAIRFLEPARDWREFSMFTFRVFNPSNNIVPINIRIDDDSIGYPDHSFMTTSRNVPVGESTVSVSFDELAAEACQRGIARFDSMTGFMFYLSRNQDHITLYFDDVQLR